MPYGGNPASSTADALRFQVGDTDNDDLLLSDEEIDYLVAQHPTLLRAAANAARTIAAKYARQVDSEIDQIRILAQFRFEHYTDLAKELDKQASLGGSGAMALGGVYAGGISKSDKELLTDDTDAVQPRFSRDMHRNTRAATLDDEEEP